MFSDFLTHELYELSGQPDRIHIPCHFPTDESSSSMNLPFHCHHRIYQQQLNIKFRPELYQLLSSNIEFIIIIRKIEKKIFTHFF